MRLAGAAAKRRNSLPLEPRPGMVTQYSKKDRSYLLEAIVDPGAKVAKGFDNFLTSVAGG
jgi:hypothetical protein